MNPGASVFLLPHQDDEFGVFHVIDRAVRARPSPLVVYLTDGAFGRAKAESRNRESTGVLARLGVPPERIRFLGQAERVPNLHLRHHLERALAVLADELAGEGPIEGLYTPAFEGGHPDHDAAALLAAALGRVLGIEDRIWQFPLYNSDRCWLRPYRVLTPVGEAGHIVRQPIPGDRRRAHLAHCFGYPSQARTFAGLFPFILAHYLLRGEQQLQRLSSDVLAGRPHAGRLLYERRGWLTWADFERDVAMFRSSHGLPLA